VSVKNAISVGIALERRHDLLELQINSGFLGSCFCCRTCSAVNGPLNRHGHG